MLPQLKLIFICKCIPPVICFFFFFSPSSTRRSYFFEHFVIISHPCTTISPSPAVSMVAIWLLMGLIHKSRNIQLCHLRKCNIKLHPICFPFMHTHAWIYWGNREIGTLWNYFSSLPSCFLSKYSNGCNYCVFCCIRFFFQDCTLIQCQGEKIIKISDVKI